MEKINQATTMCQVSILIMISSYWYSILLHTQKQNYTGSEFSTCVANGIVEDVTRLTDSKATMSTYADLMSSRLRNYTCADDSLNSTEPVNISQNYFIYFVLILPASFLD